MEKVQLMLTKDVVKKITNIGVHNRVNADQIKTQMTYSAVMMDTTTAINLNHVSQTMKNVAIPNSVITSIQIDAVKT